MINCVEQKKSGPAAALFAKAPELGRVKTRLAATIGKEAALELHLAFVEDSLSRIQAVPVEPIGRYLYLTSEWNADLYSIPKSAKGIVFKYQCEGDLGERMKSAMEELFSSGHSSALIIGTDSPNLPVKYLIDAVEIMNRFDCVLGPAEDGGYYLIGVRSEVRSRISLLFDGIEWSTNLVFSKTIERVEAEQLNYCCLPVWYDVDSASDLSRLKHEIEVGISDPSECPCTAALLSERKYVGVI